MLVVIGKSLDTHVGHQHTEIAAIRALSGRPDFPILTRRGADPGFADGQHAVHAILATARDRKAGIDAVLEQDVAAVLAYLATLPGENPVDVLVPSGFVLDLLTAIRVLDRTGPAVRFHLRILVEGEVADLGHDDLEALKRLAREGRLFLLTETPALSDRLRDQYGLPAQDSLLMPCSLTEASPPSKRRSGARFRVGFLGAPRRDKGAELIPGIIRALRRQLGSAEPDLALELIVQAPNRARYSLRHLKYDAALKGAGIPSPYSGRRLKVSTYPHGQPPEVFEALLRSMDVVLLPYDADLYRYRGSGIVLDAVLAGIPIVHTQGIGMAEFLTHGNALAATGAEGFAAAVLEACRDNAALKTNAPAAQAAFEAQLQKARAYLRGLPA